MLSACTEERIVGWNPPLGSLPGATSGMPVTHEGRFNFADPRAAPEGGIRQVDENGDITLYARSGRHLMSHIYITLANGERDLFVDQVLSSVTREEFVARGLDPTEAFDRLKASEPDIHALFDAMPNGEYTPGAIWKPMGHVQGDRLYRLGVAGLIARDLRYTHLDVVMERGSWRLRWFGRS